MTATFSHTLWYTAGTVLTMDDFNAVRRALIGARRKWRLIGIELGLSFADLGTVQAGYGYGTTDQPLTEMVRTWLSRRGDPRPTWESLIAALREPTVAEARLAAEIEEKYLKQTTGM